jgi:hypothetical protein
MRLPPQIDNGQLADNGESLDWCHMQGLRLHLPETNQGKEHREELLLNARQQKAICSEQNKCIPGHGTCCFFFVGPARLSDWTLTSKQRQVTRGLRSADTSTEDLAIDELFCLAIAKLVSLSPTVSAGCPGSA